MKSPKFLRVSIFCKQCGKEFLVIPAKKNRAKFCSKRCLGISNGRKNKGKKRTEAQNKRNRETHLGKIPWNKGLECLNMCGENNPAKRPEVRKKISLALKGKKHTEEQNRKMGLTKLGNKNCLGKHWKLSEEDKQKQREIAPKGNKHRSWKGQEVGYRALHSWIERELGKPVICEHCGKTGFKPHCIGWANIDHNYNRNLTDWISLCSTCHGQYDKERGLRRNTT